MSKNPKNMPKNVMTTLALAGMMLGVVVTPAMAATGDFYDTHTMISYPAASQLLMQRPLWLLGTPTVTPS